MLTIAQKRLFLAKTSEQIRPLNFSEDSINERLHRLLYAPAPGQEEEFWDSLKQRALQSIQKRLEEWLEMEATMAVGGIRPREHDVLRLTRRSGHYLRKLQTSLGLIPNLNVPKVRRKAGNQRGWAILRAYKKHRASVDDLIKDIFLAGVSTRKVHEVLKPVLGKLYSAQMVSLALRKLDGDVKAFHQRPLADTWHYLMLDGLYIKLRSGGKIRKKGILAVKGFEVNGKGEVVREELIDYLPAKSGESVQAWEGFLNDLYNRGLQGQNLRMAATDGNKGLRRAIELVWPRLPEQLCWQHKMRNVANKCRVKYQGLITENARKIYKAESKQQAIEAFHAFKKLCNPIEPKAVECIERDLPDLLHFYDQPVELWKKLRTTNSIERSFREVRRRIKTISVFSNEPSCDRIIYGVITRLNEHWRRRHEREMAKKS